MLVEAIAFSNDGKIVCRDEDQKVLFLNGLVPGETAEIDEAQNIIRIVKVSDQRTEPECPYFGECGGCDYQHVSITEQRKQKLALIDHTFKRYFKLDCPEVIDCSEGLPAYGYRNRIQLHRQTKLLGFYKPKSKEILEIKTCPITDEQINLHLKTKGYYKNHRDNITDVEISLVEGKIYERLINSSERHLSKSIDFAQVNEAGNKVLVDLVLSLIDDKFVTELYAGSGNFSLELLKKGIKVKAVELNQQLVAEGKDKTDPAKISWYRARVEDYLKNNHLQDTVLLDPPREGCNALHQARDLESVKNIVYVSCNLSTLGRDLKNLEVKGFKIQKVYFVDMFPQTKHIELVVKLIRVADGK